MVITLDKIPVKEYLANNNYNNVKLSIINSHIKLFYCDIIDNLSYNRVSSVKKSFPRESICA